MLDLVLIYCYILIKFDNIKVIINYMTSIFTIQRKYLLWDAVLPTTLTDGTAILSTSDDDSDNEAIDARDCNKLMLYLDVNMGDANSIDVQVLFSDTNLTSTTWYPRTTGTIATGVNTLSAYHERVTASGQYRIPIDIMDKYIKIQVMGNGDINNSNLVANAFVGTA